MALFLSTFVNKLDKKGRVSVPASFRLLLADQPFQGIVGFRSYQHPAIEGMDMARMQRLSDSVDKLDAFSEAQDNLTATIFADSQLMAFDGEGRVIIPPALLEHAKIKENVAFVGRGPTFQLWDPDLFAHHKDKARGRVQETGSTFKIWSVDA